MRFIFLVILAVALVTLTGCASFTTKDKNINPSLLEPQANLKFSDVPVPVGFKIMPEESFCFETGGYRTGLLTYKGKGNADLVVNFFKEQMAMYNWSLLNIVEYNQRLMNFDRENETCIITITPKGASLSTITIALGPKSQQYINKKREKPLK